MCGRYVIISTPEAIRKLFGYAEQPNFPPRYNVAPTQPIPVVRLDGGKRSFVLMRWGFLPAWVKDPKGFPLLINARGESVLDKPAFRNAIRRRRCLIPTDGFYEWQAGNGPAARRPYFVRAKREPGEEVSPLAFAGVFETWTGPNGEELDTVAIVTTTANRTLSALHDRMPVFITPDAFDMWLDCARVEAELAASLIRPADEDLLEAYPVSTAVNRVVNDAAALVAPAPAEIAQETAPEVAAVKPARPRAKKAREPNGQASLF
ncbi:MAG TPA: SOS response-associated peptidase [Xanthobacteraceae bacterium]|jgi:putative SOS response-associated peptidase YedK|nr:SOS response-associated peptidase [Xanthobacteraceae bacterium]